MITMPLWLWLVVLAVIGVVVLVMKAIASTRSLDSTTYSPTVGPIVRRYPRQPTDAAATLRSAINRVPKASIAAQNGSAIFVNLGASAGRLDDSFGLFVRVVSRNDGAFWIVSIDGKPRVGGTSRGERVTLQAFERELRHKLGDLGYRIDDGLSAAAPPATSAPPATPSSSVPNKSVPSATNHVAPPAPRVSAPAVHAAMAPAAVWNGLPTPGRVAPTIEPPATPSWLSPPSSPVPWETPIASPAFPAPTAVPAAGLRLVLTTSHGRRPISSMAVIGRDPVVRADEPPDTERIVISDPLASKTHAAVGGDHVSAWVEDRRSVNGVTVINAQGASRSLVPSVREPLQLGDVIRIGEQSLVVSAEEGSP